VAGLDVVTEHLLELVLTVVAGVVSFSIFARVRSFVRIVSALGAALLLLSGPTSSTTG
jgi:hypothetical protein